MYVQCVPVNHANIVARNTNVASRTPLCLLSIQIDMYEIQMAAVSILGFKKYESKPYGFFLGKNGTKMSPALSRFEP